MESHALLPDNKENNSITRTSTPNLQIQNYPYFRAQLRKLCLSFAHWVRINIPLTCCNG